MTSLASKRPIDQDTIVEEVNRSSAGKVKIGIADIDGILRGKAIHLDKFNSAINNGLGFCDVVFGWDSNDRCYDNVDHTGWHTGYPDSQARLDLTTYRRIPWENDTPFFLADLVDENDVLLEISPRNLLKRVRQHAVDLGFSPTFAQEFEWFNFLETSGDLHKKNFQDPTPITQGMFGYSLLRSSQNSDFFNDLFDQLNQFNVPLEGLHPESGPGVLEAAILYDDILESADRATLFKTAVKEIGHRHGIFPSFMARWSTQYPGCSGHIHQSLWNLDRTENLFFDDGMSDLMQHYLAGQLHCLPHILPMYAPTINSYKRLVEGFWAPTTVSWGIDNRTVAARVLLGGPKATRIELRVVGSDVNPYLAMVASLASGLYGIKHRIPLTHPQTTANAYENGGTRLSRSLVEATRKMKQSDIPKQLFGETFVKHFIQTREWEWQQHLEAITDWEFQRYFEII